MTRARAAPKSASVSRHVPHTPGTAPTSGSVTASAQSTATRSRSCGGEAGPRAPALLPPPPPAEAPDPDPGGPTAAAVVDGAPAAATMAPSGLP